MPPYGQINIKDIDLKAKNLWHTKVRVILHGNYNCILKNFTFIGTQYLPYAEKSTRK